MSGGCGWATRWEITETSLTETTTSSGLGALDRAGWAAMLAFIAALPDSPVAEPVTVDQLLTDDLLSPS